VFGLDLARLVVHADRASPAASSSAAAAVRALLPSSFIVRRGHDDGDRFHAGSLLLIGFADTTPVDWSAGTAALDRAAGRSRSAQRADVSHAPYALVSAAGG